MCSDEDLDLVESAVSRLLQRQEEVVEEVSPGGTTRTGLLSRLIDEVHEMRSTRAAEQKFVDKPDAAPAPSVDNDRVLINPYGDANLVPNATDAAVRAAVAAAQAAQAAADAVAKNSQIIEVLLETVKSQQQEQDQALFLDPDNEAEQYVKQKKSDKRKQKVSALIKDVRKQNWVTHIILGVMVISTAIWRYKEISWIMRLRKMVTNPLEAVGGIFGGGEHTHKYKEEVEAKPLLELPHLELPQLFHKEEHEETTTVTP